MIFRQLSLTLLLAGLNWNVQEELAAINLAKYRKAQHDLEEAEERLAESVELANKSRVRNSRLTMSSPAPNRSVGLCAQC